MTDLQVNLFVFSHIAFFIIIFNSVGDTGSELHQIKLRTSIQILASL